MEGNIDCKKAEYMIAWREKKIKNLEERLEVYAEMVNMCLALCMAGSDGVISKKKVREGLTYRYDISENEEYYFINRREDETDIKKDGGEG